MGVQEIAGEADNARILEYHSKTALQASSDEVPWCSAFVNWVFAQCKIKGTNSAAALSWLDWGKKTLHPAYGGLVIYDYGGGRGHVGFCVGYKKVKKTYYLAVLGGNQDNMVKISWFKGGKAAGYRWPISKPIPADAFSLPLLDKEPELSC